MISRYITRPALIFGGRFVRIDPSAASTYVCAPNTLHFQKGFFLFHAVPYPLLLYPTIPLFSLSFLARSWSRRNGTSPNSTTDLPFASNVSIRAQDSPPLEKPNSPLGLYLGQVCSIPRFCATCGVCRRGPVLPVGALQERKRTWHRDVKSLLVVVVVSIETGRWWRANGCHPVSMHGYCATDEARMRRRGSI